MAVNGGFSDTAAMAAIATTLGRVLRSARSRRGLSQESLAGLAGVNRSYLGQIERGEVQVSVAALQKIADALGEELSALIGKYEHDRE